MEVMKGRIEALAAKALGVKGPFWELSVAVTGCLLGSLLLLGSIQIFCDVNSALEERKPPLNYFTLNKKIEGSLLVGLLKDEDGFTIEETKAISNFPGVLEVGAFTRLRSEVMIHIWPMGKIGMGSAAKADVFFESVPDTFIDVDLKEWKWDQNASYVPLIIPKFYLDLWNFGFAPTRADYPTLSAEVALKMPIKIFVGDKRENSYDGKFVAFSRRINSIITPQSFLEYANSKYADESNSSKVFSLFESKAEKNILPARLIVRVDKAPSESLLTFFKEKGYEINRELPTRDKLQEASGMISLAVGIIGILLSILSMATFSSSFRLVVTRAAIPTRNLFHLGFSRSVASRVFVRRFLKIFGIVFFAGIALTFLLKEIGIKPLAGAVGLKMSSGLDIVTLLVAAIYGCIFVAVNIIIIRNSVRNLN